MGIRRSAAVAGAAPWCCRYRACILTAVLPRESNNEILLLLLFIDPALIIDARGWRELRARGTSAGCGPSGALKIVYQKHNKR